jgi:ParB-like chromosome segregation protein Spo0J
MGKNGKPATIRADLRNRVVGMGEEAPDQLLANPANFRIHPDAQQQALAGSIDGVGWIDPVIVNRLSGHVVDGHLRVTLALRSGVKSIPVVYVELSDDDEAQALLSLDPIAAMAATDKAQLDALLRAVQSDDERVQEMLAGIYEVELSGENYTDPKLPEAYQEIRPREMFHVLISVPLDSAIDLRGIVEQANNIDGVEIIYGAN